ncbi:MAG TPA: NIPSNAP family protein [Candidatus Udaeobacter sp.]
MKDALNSTVSILRALSFLMATIPFAEQGFAMEKPNAQRTETCCPIIELRQYTLHPGQRDVLIDLFDREFVESQEELGMKVIGQFRDLDNPNRFVWLRGFRDMPSRAQALKDFYGGPVWKAHREAANATMIDSDNVLLLHPTTPTSAFSFGNKERPRVGTGETRSELVVATIYYFDVPVNAAFVEFFEKTVKPAVVGSGATVLAYLVTEHSENTFPALPVRQGENIFVWLARFNDLFAYERHLGALTQFPRWHDEISKELARPLKRQPEILKLSPTTRSLL